MMDWGLFAAGVFSGVLVLFVGVGIIGRKLQKESIGGHLYSIYISNEHQVILKCITCGQTQIINRRKKE